MSSRLQRYEALEKEDRIDEMKKKKKKKKNSPPVPYLLQAQQAPVLPYAKVVGQVWNAQIWNGPSPDIFDGICSKATQVLNLLIIPT